MIRSSLNLDFLIRASLSAGPDSAYFWRSFQGVTSHARSPWRQPIGWAQPSRTAGVSETAD